MVFMSSHSSVSIMTRYHPVERGVRARKGGEFSIAILGEFSTTLFSEDDMPDEAVWMEDRVAHPFWEACHSWGGEGDEDRTKTFFVGPNYSPIALRDVSEQRSSGNG